MSIRRGLAIGSIVGACALLVGCTAPIAVAPLPGPSTAAGEQPDAELATSIDYNEAEHFTVVVPGTPRLATSEDPPKVASDKDPAIQGALSITVSDGTVLWVSGQGSAEERDALLAALSTRDYLAGVTVEVSWVEYDVEDYYPRSEWPAEVAVYDNGPSGFSMEAAYGGVLGLIDGCVTLEPALPGNDPMLLVFPTSLLPRFDESVLTLGSIRHVIGEKIEGGGGFADIPDGASIPTACLPFAGDRVFLVGASG